MLTSRLPRSWCLPFLLIASACNASANDVGQWYLQLDNDIIFGDDGDFTNGINLGYKHSLLSVDIKSPTWFEWQKQLLLPQAQYEHTWAIGLSQRMWTPNEIEHSTPQPFDRPYAGTLMAEFHGALYTSDLAQKNWISLGIIGPESGNEALQNWVHKVTGSSPPKGWQYQIERQFIAQYAYEIESLLYRNESFATSEWELSGFSHNEVGHLRSEIQAGLSLRWGFDLAKSFGHLSNHYGDAGLLNTAGSMSQFILFSRVFIGYRFNDLTISGDLSYTSEIDIAHQQAGVSVGAIWDHPAWSVSWTFNGYSKEYTDDNSAWHGYGSLLFSWKL